MRLIEEARAREEAEEMARLDEELRIAEAEKEKLLVQKQSSEG